ncbi:MAG: nuclear transport factor 2 family protein [Candidatus Thorarchaeota archaeon]|jgi:ketosteroid isomerase-like protein
MTESTVPYKNDLTREENIETVRRFVRFLEQRRLKEFSELFTENGKWIHPYHSGMFPAETVGREEIFNAIKAAADNFDEIQFPIDEILPFEDPSRIAMKHRGKLNLKNGSGTYENDYFTILTFDEEGKITEWVEYYNPVIAAKAFGLMDKIQ